MTNYIHRLVDSYRHHMARRRTYVTLTSLTNRQLEDIGLNRMDVYDAAYGRSGKRGF